MAGTPVRIFPLDSGLNLNVNPFRLSPGETPDAVNVDYDRGSVKASGGAIKLGNKVAPRPGVLCRPSMDGRLPVLYGKSAPVVGHVTIPWKHEQDIGGNFFEAVHTTETDRRSARVFSAARGKGFDRKVSFRLPETEKLFSAPTNPGNSTNYDAGSDLRTYAGADLAIDEMTIIAQKGGDGMTPMSWALGIVNTGGLLDVDVAGGNNVLGVATSVYAKRPSNYMLCFMWLDAPGYGAWRPSGMRYLLSSGTVSEAVDGTGSGDHCTLAYRAMVAPLFIEPGRTYHVEMGLALDTGSAGADGDSTPTTAWNGDGVLQFHCVTDDGSVQEFEYDQAAPSSATIYRWKGPGDSLEYFAKYGVRWSGREEEHLGLGYRCAPWTNAGSIHAGIDSAPLEVGGFGISDHSEKDVSSYNDYTAPDLPPSVSNTQIVAHQLRCAHVGSTTGVEINYQGMVDFGTGLASNWGTETGVWDGIYVGGRHPWGIHDQAWQGLDPASTGGVNTEALRGYRLVFQNDGAGVTALQGAGFMLTINTMENTATGTALSYSYKMTPETGLGFVDNGADFGTHASHVNTDAGGYAVVVRAFRWNQRAIEISDYRAYSSPRSYTDKQAEWSLWHETVLNDTTEPGVADLVGLWPLTDGGGGVCKDQVAGNHGVFAPFALPVVDGGLEGGKQVYLSGEGERIELDFSTNPVLKDLLRQALQDGGVGCAIQLRFRSTGAVYGQSRKIAGPADGTAGVTDALWESQFAPDLLTWSVKDVDSKASANGEPSFEHGQHVQLRPLITFGHRIHTEFRMGDPSSNFGRSEPWYHPMPFDVKCAVDGDEEGLGLFVPGSEQSSSAAYGYPWYQVANVNVNRYHKDADWVGRTLTVQVGIEPSSTDDTVKVYIAWTPSDALINTTQQPDAEFAFWESETFHRRDLERSVITVGGAADPFERSWMGMGAKLFVDAVRVFGCAAPGDLPTGSGAAVATGTGKIRGGHAHPDRELLVADILRPVGGGNQAVTVTGGSATVDAAGNTSFPTGRPEVDLSNILGSFLQVQDEELVVPQEEKLKTSYPKGYLIEAVAADTLTLARPYEGDSKVGVAASTYRLIGYSAFGDAIQDKPLPVGKGKPLTYGDTLVGDAVQTAIYWKNPAPGGADWRVTLLSPVAVGRATDIHPAWCRGLMSSRENRILGLRAVEDVLYAAAQGSLFEADDRWRLEGPTRTLNRALHYRARRDDGGFSIPLQDDRVEFDDASVVAFPVSGRQLVFDARFCLDDYYSIQTIAWSGRTDTDPAKDANEATGHSVTWWVRLRDGHPEFVIGSTGVAGGSVPEQGLFVAKAEARVPVGEYVHLRVMLERDGSNFKEPTFFINGKIVPTIVRVTEDTLTSPDWIIQNNALFADSDYTLVLGCARDSITQASVSNDTESVVPDRRQGWMHSLGGKLSALVISTQTNNAKFSDSTNFDPNAVDYTAAVAGWVALVQTLSVGSEVGAGHMLEDTLQQRFGRIHSHPLISMWHEMGDSANPVSFATYGREIFAANGGRVAIIEDRAVRPAGLLAPVNVPDFTLERDPVFEVNEFDSTGSVDNDAILQLASDDPAVTTRAYHLAVPGSTYIRQLGDPNMDWGPNKFFAWSALLRMDSVAGRIPLYSRRNSLRAGGPFVECRDGFVYIGWWDTSLKKEVFIRTSKPVIEPGFDTYISVRKWYPRRGIQTGAEKYWGGATLAGGSNWINSQFDYDIQNTTGDGLMRDMCVVRKVPKEDLTSPANYARWSGFDAKASIDYPAGGTWFTQTSSDRMCVSFVSEDTDISTLLQSGEEYTITGPVLAEIATFDGADTDAITIAGVSQTFTLDHTGMLIQLARRVTGTPSTNFDGAVFRIVVVNSTTKVTVVNLDGTSPTFVAGDFPASIGAIVAPDVSMVKSESFDSSEHPDEATYPIEMLGSQLQAQPLNGIMPFRGIMHCVKYGMFTGTVADGDGNLIEEVDIFQDASAAIAATAVSGCEIGADRVGRDSGSTPTSIADLPYAGTDFRRLQVEDQFVLTSVNCRLLEVATDPATPQPNDLRKIERDSYSTNKNDLAFATPEGTEPAQGLRRIRTRFIDPKNGAVSAPSEELQVFAVAEDLENPSENLRLVLTGLPVSADPQETLLQIFMTVVDGSEFFLAGEVDSRSDSFSFRVDDLFLAGVDTVLDFREGAAPHAHVVGVAQGAMWYGDITVEGVRQEDVVAFSVPYKPEVVPPGQEAPVDTGNRIGIVGIAEYGGQAVVFKRNSIFAANILSVGGNLVLSTRQISPNDGAVSAQSIVPFEGRLYFISDRGPMVLFNLEAEPVFIGRRLSPYFTDTIDPSSLPLISASVNRERDQYVFTAHDTALSFAQDRFAIEFDHPADGDAVVNAVIAGHRFSKYQGPRVTALGSVVSKDGGPHTLVGGTAEGFVIWMDRGDVRTVMMGPTTGVWGSTTLVAGVGNIFTGTVDDVFEGPRGAPLRWLDTSGAEQFGYVDRAYLDQNSDLRILLVGDGGAVSPVPVSAATVTLGALLAHWSTSEIYYDAPHLTKEGAWVDITRALKASGQLIVDVYRDLATAAEAGQITLDLTESFSSEDLGAIVKETRTMRLLMRTVTPAVDVDFELLDVTVRARVTDNR